MDKKLEKMKLDIQKRIKQNTGLLICSTIFLIVAASGTVITGYFNFTVFLTMIGVTLLQCIIQILLKWYYTRSTLGDDMED